MSTDFDYAALADTIKIEDITSNNQNQSILHKLKDNDESFDSLHIVDDEADDDDEYYPIDGEDIGWLGYYIGQNTKLKCLYFYETIDDESFYKETCHNKSIEEIHFNENGSLDGDVIRMLDPFFKNNHNLTEIYLVRCGLGAEDTRQLSLAIGSCNKLKHIEITNNEMEDEQLVDIITAVSMHPQLEELDLSENGTFGRNVCTALTILLRHTTTQLKTLILYDSNINDVGIGLLLPALRGNALQKLNLGSNRLITINGWKRVAALLEMPESNLKELLIHGNTIGYEGLRSFVNALANNSTLESLNLDTYSFTAEGWEIISKLLCDTSSINNTYLSNHTLTSLDSNHGDRGGVNAFLAANKREDKQQVAIRKILDHHSHFNMEPFFEWELKVLPIMMEWFTKASPCASAEYYEEKINKMKLSVIHDFVKEFPMLYIEPMSRKEIAEYTAFEEELQGDKLIEIQQLKARALRRL